MNQVQQDLEATYDYLDAKGWCQGTFQQPDGKVCLEGAAAAVTMGAPNYWGTRRGHVQGAYSTGGTGLLGEVGPTQWRDVPREHINRFADVLDALAGQLPKGIHGSTFLWNDEPRRTVEDVKDLIKAAIKAEADK